MQVETQDGHARVKVRASYVDGLLRYALSMGAECKVLEPADAVEGWRKMAERVLSKHQASEVRS